MAQLTFTQYCKRIARLSQIAQRNAAQHPRRAALARATIRANRKYHRHHAVALRWYLQQGVTLQWCCIHGHYLPH